MDECIDRSIYAPVLSEQMSVTVPSASSAVSLRTMVRARAMRWTPTAMATVTTGRSPSGMSATAIEMTYRRISCRKLLGLLLLV